jgi:RsiW-degrading membrane proteinase PrsW (M82 family)
MKKIFRAEFIIPIIYLLIFVVCMFLASDFKPESTNWVIATFVLTLPWSILTGFFVMGALHLGDDSGAIVTLSFTAILNASLLFWICKPRKKAEVKISIEN